MTTTGANIMNSIRVLVVDDHPLLRLGVRRYLETTDAYQIVGECVDLAAARTWLADDGMADIAILDRNLPDGDGLELVPVLKGAGIKIIVLTVEDGGDEIREAIEAGVDGYLLKSFDGEHLFQAISAALQNRGVYSHQIMQALISVPSIPLIDRLSHRELEVAEYVAQGYSNKQICTTLEISENTTRNHVANAMQKLGLHSRVQLAALVLQHWKKAKSP